MRRFVVVRSIALASSCARRAVDLLRECVGCGWRCSFSHRDPNAPRVETVSRRRTRATSLGVAVRDPRRRCSAGPKAGGPARCARVHAVGRNAEASSSTAAPNATSSSVRRAACCPRCVGVWYSRTSPRRRRYGVPRDRDHRGGPTTTRDRRCILVRPSDSLCSRRCVQITESPTHPQRRG